MSWLRMGLAFLQWCWATWSARLYVMIVNCFPHLDLIHCAMLLFCPGGGRVIQDGGDGVDVSTIRWGGVGSDLLMKSFKPGHTRWVWWLSVEVHPSIVLIFCSCVCCKCGCIVSWINSIASICALSHELGCPVSTSWDLSMLWQAGHQVLPLFPWWYVLKMTVSENCLLCCFCK